MDHFSSFFTQTAPSARVFYSGNLCQLSNFDADPTTGHLHYLRQGTLSVSDEHGVAKLIRQPSLIFFPQSLPHQLLPTDRQGVDLVCATVNFGEDARMAFVSSLPKSVIIPLNTAATLQPALEILFAEAFDKYRGHQLALDVLMQYVFILLLRYLIDHQRIQSGIVAALADPRLAPVVAAMHQHPEKLWSLDLLADVAAMSRARFASHFRAVTGLTPLSYLTTWRMALTQRLLLQEKTVKAIAPKVGYASAVALTRIFTARLGLSPTAWLQSQSQALDQGGAHEMLAKHQPFLTQRR